MAKKNQPKQTTTILREELSSHPCMHFVLHNALNNEYDRVLKDEQLFIRDNERAIIQPELYIQLVKKLKVAMEVNNARRER